MPLAALAKPYLCRRLPTCCVFCAGPTLRRVCPGCRRDLPRVPHACPRCAEPLPLAVAPGVCCARCQRRPPPWQRCVAAFPYEWPVDRAIKALKFSRQLSFAAAFGELLAPLLAAELPHADALCPVPLHRFRHARRGFNQADEICRSLRRACDLPLFLGTRRRRATPPQTGLRRAERRRNLAGAFALSAALLARRPLIVDDVMTTGETCRQLAGLLLENGAEEVSVLVVARAAGGPQAAGVNV